MRESRLKAASPNSTLAMKRGLNEQSSPNLSLEYLAASRFSRTRRPISAFDYDEMGHEIGVNFFDEAGNLRDYYRTEYGADGQQIKTSRYNGDGTLTEVTTYG